MLRFTEAYKVYTEAYNNANEQISRAKSHSCKEDIVISLIMLQKLLRSEERRVGKE